MKDFILLTLFTLGSLFVGYQTRVLTAGPSPKMVFALAASECYRGIDLEPYREEIYYLFGPTPDEVQLGTFFDALLYSCITSKMEKL